MIALNTNPSPRRNYFLRTLWVILPLAIVFFTVQTKSEDLPELQTATYIDIPTYMGTWYEIASIPTSFQNDCMGTTATYSMANNGTIDILNSCHKGALDGPMSYAHGVAKIDDPTTNAKFKVKFFLVFSGDYWILEIGENYEYAVVGHPSRKYLWILSRTPTMDAGVYDGILERLRGQYYDLTNLQKTVQPTAVY